jgi:hypothetical protein
MTEQPMSDADVGAGDILIRITDSAAEALPPDVLASLKNAARRLEEITTMNPSMKCAKVTITTCAVFTECTGVTF